MDKLKNWIKENIHKMDVDEPNAAGWDRLKDSLVKSAESDLLKDHIVTNKSKLEIESPDVQSWKVISSSITTKKITYARSIKRRIIYLSAACILVMVGLGLLRYMNVAQINHDKGNVKNTLVKNSDQKNDTTDVEPTKNELIATQPLPDQSPKQEFAADSFKVKEGATVEDILKELPGFQVDSRGNITAQGKRVDKVLAKKQQRKSLPLEVLQVEKDYDELIAEQIKYTKSLALYGESVDYFQKFKNDFKALENQEKELRKSIAQSGLKENNIDDLAMIYQQKLTVLKKLQNEINKTSNCNKNVTDTIPAYLSL